jgi:hypothetical protein
LKAVSCGDPEQVKIVGLRTEDEFNDNISDMEDLFPTEPCETGVHTNIVFDIDNDKTPDSSIPDAGPSQGRLVTHCNHCMNIESSTDMEGQETFFNLNFVS